MGLPWKIRSEPPADQVGSLASALGLRPVLAKILCQRGITTPEEGRRFLAPDLKDLHSPFDLYDMDRAVDRVVQAISSKEEIGIFGDFDVDGITGSSLLSRFFQKLGIETHCRLPNRLSDGYGLSTGAVDSLREKNVSLLITVDCGITAVEEVDYANSLGMDCIVTDHHQPKDELPKGYAVVNPRRAECNYPFMDLTGVGLAWKLADAVGERIGEDRRLLRGFASVTTDCGGAGDSYLGFRYTQASSYGLPGSKGYLGVSPAGQLITGPLGND